VEVFDLRQEPRVYRRQPMNLGQAQTDSEGIGEIPDTLRARLAERHLDFLAVDTQFVEAIDADFKSPQSLLQGFLEGAPDGHHFAHGFHLGRQP
jgi:hypothetical protein